MATINNFEDLEIWQNARELCKKINQYCLHNPKFLNHDKNQIDRASASIMDNIAEGFEREGNKEFVNFLTMSKGSAGEVRSQLIRAFDRNYIDEEVFSVLDKYEKPKEIIFLPKFLQTESGKILRKETSENI